MQEPGEPDLTADGRGRLVELARRHGVSPDAAVTLLRAVAAGGGRMAQFSHPELGGMGQWATGGMVMVGDMFNQELRQRVDALATDLAALLREGSPFVSTSPTVARAAQTQEQRWPASGAAHGDAGGSWWPEELGVPAATGAQNAMRYAYFPAARRLAVEQGGRLSLYDTDEHRITGVSQQQGGRGHPLAFSTDAGALHLDALRRVDAGAARPPTPEPDGDREAVPDATTPAASGTGAGDPLTLIERLAELHRKGVLAEEEFAAKKAELLRRV